MSTSERGLENAWKKPHLICVIESAVHFVRPMKARWVYNVHWNALWHISCPSEEWTCAWMDTLFEIMRNLSLSWHCLLDAGMVSITWSLHNLCEHLPKLWVQFQHIWKWGMPLRVTQWMHVLCICSCERNKINWYVFGLLSLIWQCCLVWIPCFPSFSSQSDMMYHHRVTWVYSYLLTDLNHSEC